MSLTVPVTSNSSSGPNSIIDEDTPESESSQKSTKKLTLTLDNFDDSEESSAHATMTPPMVTSLSVVGGPATATLTAHGTHSTSVSTSISSSSSAPQQKLSQQKAQDVQDVVDAVVAEQSSNNNNNNRFSHLSIKFIDDNSVSAPLSPEQHQFNASNNQQQQRQQSSHVDEQLQQQLHYQHGLAYDDLKPYEPSDTDADSNLASTSAPLPPSNFLN